MSNHALNRTSPKGQPFVGTCFKCGMENLPAEAVAWPCENPANLSQGEALLVAVALDRSADDAK